MLCARCDTFLLDLIHGNFANWNRLAEDRYTFKHGNYHTISASAAGGCPLCHLFGIVRAKRIPGFDHLAEKWLLQNASIDARSSGQKHTFQLFTEAPSHSWIAFELFHPQTERNDVPREEPTMLDLPKELPGSALSDVAICTAKHWIEQCQGAHMECHRKDKTPLPTRVIDVGYSDDVAFAKLQINYGHMGSYLTLSHCWGIGNRLTTTKRHLKEFQNAIPYSRMPKTFQDAICLTRMLGFLYLWIDALCIVQDDPQDWKREAATMCSVYENATFSISALSATDSNSGLFQDREIDQCVVNVAGMTIGIRPKLDSISEALPKFKLGSRAWCMQERILAPAILHIGSQQLYWECRSLVASETCPEGHGDIQETAQLSHRHITFNTDRQTLLDLWYDLVSKYSERDLTKPSDRLPAIAGLADKIRGELSGPSPYANGLWIDDLAAGLLWQRRPERERDIHTATSSHSQTTRPRHDFISSWSWASCRGAVDYTWRSQFNVPAPSQHDFVGTLEEHTAKAILNVEGIVKRGTCRLAAAGSRGSKAMFKPSGSSIVLDSITFVLDSTDDVIPKQCYCLRISAWSSTAGTPRRKAKVSDTMVFYLVLERIQGSMDDVGASSKDRLKSLGRFKRIGAGYDTQAKVDRVFSNAGRHSLEIA